MGKILNIILGILNLNDAEKTENSKKMPTLLQELYDSLIACENNTTMSMALVGQKRLSLRKLVDKQNRLRDNAKKMEISGYADKAKAFLKQAVEMDEEIERITEEVLTLDSQAKNEIIHFRSLEKDVERLKGEIKRADSLEKFNTIRERVSQTSGKFNQSIVAQIETYVEETELKSAQLAAQMVLDGNSTEDFLLNQEADQLIMEERLNDEYKKLQIEINNTNSPETNETKLLEAPADRARKLLNQPAFDGILLKKI